MSAGLESIVAIILGESFLPVQFSSSLNCGINTRTDGTPYGHGGDVLHPEEIEKTLNP